MDKNKLDLAMMNTFQSYNLRSSSGSEFIARNRAGRGWLMQKLIAVMLLASFCTVMSLAHAIPGDENWSSQFGVAGADWKVSAMVSDSAGNMYVGGSFLAVDGVLVNRIAKWDGSQWSALGSGMNNTVSSLVLDSNGNLYAGGDFTNAGGVSANRIAKWDGTNWSALGSSISGPVLSLAMGSGGMLYVGGAFTTVNGLNASYIAKWDGGVQA